MLMLSNHSITPVCVVDKDNATMKPEQHASVCVLQPVGYVGPGPSCWGPCFGACVVYPIRLSWACSTVRTYVRMYVGVLCLPACDCAVLVYMCLCRERVCVLSVQMRGQLLPGSMAACTRRHQPRMTKEGLMRACMMHWCGVSGAVGKRGRPAHPIQMQHESCCMVHMRYA
jgi:hypothetical protein